MLSGDPPGKPPPHRNADALAHLFLQPGGRGRDQLPGGKVQQQHRGRVSPQDLSRTIQQLNEQLAVIEPGQRGIRDRLDGPEPGLSGDEIYLRCHLDASQVEDLCDKHTHNGTQVCNFPSCRSRR